MKYRELKQLLDKMTESELDQTVTVFVEDVGEFYPVLSAGVASEDNDVLDPGHVYLFIGE